MVRAIRSGTKTQTRRLHGLKYFNGQPDRWRLEGNIMAFDGGFEYVPLTKCPYGAPGDFLWVREKFSPYLYRFGCWYWADGNEAPYAATISKPSIFMPRWASRITLEIVDVRVQRVQDISEADALAEGIIEDTFPLWPDEPGFPGKRPVWRYDVDCANSPQLAYARLWNSINAKPKPVYSTDDNGKKEIAYYQSFPWEAGTRNDTHQGKPWFVIGNPWVWALTFKVVQ
jgi:hypothetical protein